MVEEQMVAQRPLGKTRFKWNNQQQRSWIHKMSLNVATLNNVRSSSSSLLTNKSSNYSQHKATGQMDSCSSSLALASAPTLVVSTVVESTVLGLALVDGTTTTHICHYFKHPFFPRSVEGTWVHCLLRLLS
jgi:hypothetical protein